MQFENIDLPSSETAASDAEASAASASAAAAPALPAPAPATAMSVFWSANQWAYDNIGVSKPPSVDARHRFLTCADCDRGPLGVCFPKDEPEQLYLAADRVKYTDK